MTATSVIAKVLTGHARATKPSASDFNKMGKAVHATPIAQYDVHDFFYMVAIKGMPWLGFTTDAMHADGDEPYSHYGKDAFRYCFTYGFDFDDGFYSTQALHQLVDKLQNELQPIGYYTTFSSTDAHNRIRLVCAAAKPFMSYADHMAYMRYANKTYFANHVDKSTCPSKLWQGGTNGYVLF